MDTGHHLYYVVPDQPLWNLLPIVNSTAPTVVQLCSSGSGCLSLCSYPRVTFSSIARYGCCAEKIFSCGGSRTTEQYTSVLASRVCSARVSSSPLKNVCISAGSLSGPGPAASDGPRQPPLPLPVWVRGGSQMCLVASWKDPTLLLPRHSGGTSGHRKAGNAKWFGYCRWLLTIFVCRGQQNDNTL